MIIVETGEGLEDSNSLLSIEESDGIANRLLLDPDLWINDPNKERLLMRGTLYLDSTIRWVSVPLKDNQALEWPRKEFMDFYGRTVGGESIPEALKEAVLAVAFTEATREEGTMFESVPAIKSERYNKTSVTYATPQEKDEGQASLFIQRLRLLGYARGAANFRFGRA